MRMCMVPSSDEAFPKASEYQLSSDVWSEFLSRVAQKKGKYNQGFQQVKKQSGGKAPEFFHFENKV